MTLSLAALGIAFLGGDNNTFSSVLALGGLIVYVGAFAFGLGPNVYLLNSEVYPLHVRGKAAGLGSAVNWVANFAVALTFPLLISEIGETSAFWIYTGIAALAFVYVLRVVPETRGRSLEEVQEMFSARAGATS